MSDIIHIVALGKSGVGKSSVANTIFGESVFTVSSSSNSVTAQCESFSKTVDGRSLKWIDTPGVFDTHRSDTDIKKEILRCIEECYPGPHVFLIMLKIERYTSQEEDVIKVLNNYFSEKALKFSIVLFTHGDNLVDKTLWDFVNENEGLKSLVQGCGNRCHVVDNRYWKENQEQHRSNQSQLKELFQTIDQMIADNGGKCYTNHFLQQPMDKILLDVYRFSAAALMAAFLGRNVLNNLV